MARLDLDPYRGLGEAQGGKVIPNDRWEREINALIGDPVRRAQLSVNARKWAAREDVMMHLHEWVETFTDAIAYAAEDAAVQQRR